VATPFKAPKVRGTTARGEFEITLRADVAPNTCAMFLDLVRGEFYAGLTFHRVVPDFVVQGGDPTGTGWGGPGYTIRSEWSPLPYGRGAVGIAHSGKDTGGCQWFVTLSEQPHLVGRYTVFGAITRGLEVFDGMQPGDTFDLAVVP
jgi:peptidyl-prolyl cis-trans isomerase B (cyclophilin B)